MRITGDDLKSGLLLVFVIYDHPKDQPAGWLVRAQVVAAGMIFHSQWANTFATLEEAREFCARRGLKRIPRAETDDPVIVESWV